MQGVRGHGHLLAPAHQERMQGVRGSGHLPAPAPEERVQAVQQQRRRSECKQWTGWRSSEKILIIAPQLIEVHSTRLVDGTQCYSTSGGAA